MDKIGSHEYWLVQNTGWSGGGSWFDTGGSLMNPLRFTSEKAAIDYGKKQKSKLDQDTTLWRVVQVELDHYENGEVTRKYWFEI